MHGNDGRADRAAAGRVGQVAGWLLAVALLVVASGAPAQQSAPQDAGRTSAPGPRSETISKRPVTASRYDSPDWAFRGDWSRANGEQYRITGSDTLGTPRTGYLFTPEATPHFLYVYNQSGHNESTSGNLGRTGAAGYRIQGYQAGQGDLINFSGSCFVTGARPGATNFLANPACSLFAGDSFAGHNGVYLNPVEINLNDQGYDAAGIGAVFNLRRTNGTGNLGAFWAGVRLQQAGQGAVDTAWSATGRFRFGLDFSGVTFGAEGAAIVLAQKQRIYGNAINGDPMLRFPTSLGADWISDEPAVQGWDFVVGGGSRLQISSKQITASQPVAATAFKGSAGLRSVLLGLSQYVGTGASVSCARGFSCDQVSGTFMLVTGAGTLVTGPVLTIEFAVSREASPTCTVSLQRNSDSPTALSVAKLSSPSRLIFYPSVALSASTSYNLDYICGGA